MGRLETGRLEIGVGSFGASGCREGMRLQVKSLRVLTWAVYNARIVASFLDPPGSVAREVYSCARYYFAFGTGWVGYSA